MTDITEASLRKLGWKQIKMTPEWMDILDLEAEEGDLEIAYEKRVWGGYSYLLDIYPSSIRITDKSISQVVYQGACGSLDELKQIMELLKIK